MENENQAMTRQEDSAEEDSTPAADLKPKPPLGWLLVVLGLLLSVAKKTSREFQARA